MNSADELIVLRMDCYKTKFEWSWERNVDDYYGPTSATVDRLKEFGDGITLYQKKEGDGYTRSFTTRFVICPKSRIEEGKFVLLGALIEVEEDNLSKLVEERKKLESERRGEIRKLKSKRNAVERKLWKKKNG